MSELRLLVLSGLLGLGLLGAGCAPSLGQARARDVDTSVPEAFSARTSTTSAGTSTATTSSARLRPEAFFEDPNLVALVDEALKNNQELDIVAQEIVVRNFEIMARRGEYLPSLGFGAEAGIEKVGRYTSQGAADASTEIDDGKEVPEHLPNLRLGFFASWEVDVWGKLRNATKSALYSYLASIEGRNFMVTRLVAEIASSYFELMALDNQLDVVERNIEINQDALEVVRLQKQAARVTQLAVQRFEAEVLQNQSRRYDIRQRIIETENRINLLVGRFPQPVARSSAGFVERTPKAVASGLPVDLLENRPDVRRAELELAAAKLDVEVAKARFYPSLSIEAGVGIEAFDPKHLVLFPESIIYNAVASIFAPLLNRNALTAGYFSANAEQWKAVYEYERTIRKAYMEAANQLAMIDNLDKKYALKAKQVALLESSIEVSNVLFSAARADYMEVLMTRRDALESQMELIETKQRQLSAVVNMYQALGGGWRGTDGAVREDPSASS